MSLGAMRWVGALLAALSIAVGPNVDPLAQWVREGRITATPGPHRSHHWWSDQVSRHTRQARLDRAAPRDAVRISQSSGPISSGWMAARPSTALGLAFDGPTYRVLLKWHLGIPLLPEPLEGSRCPLGCGAVVDAYGDHMVCCQRNKAWERHLGVQSFLCRCLQHAAIPHKREQSMLGDLKRDADVLIPSWDAGVGLAVDVGVCHPFPPSMDPCSVAAAADVMSNRCLGKETKYSDRCREANCTFRPLVLSTWGAFAPSCADTWQDLVRRMAAHRGGPGRTAVMEELHQGLSHALMLGVGRQLRSLLMTREFAYSAPPGPPAPRR